MVLWEATRERHFVDQASNDSGRLGEDYGLAAAAVILEEHVPTDVRDNVVENIQRRCADGALVALAGAEPIPRAEWTNLKIEFDGAGRPIVFWQNGTRAYRKISSIRARCCTTH
jgi:hypothetical protein